MTRCEDYPCCGHTDGLGCNWTYTPEARAYDEEHVMCDHAAGVCDADYYDDEDNEHVPDDCPYGGCSNCDGDLSEPDPIEDAWLDGSYEQ